MKKLNAFLETAALGEVFMAMWGFLSVFCVILFFILFSTFGNVPMWRIVLAGLAVGLLFSILLTNMLSMARKSDLFWKKAKEVRKLVEDAETTDALLDIFNNDFQELKKLAMGRPHWNERNTIHSIMKTKYKSIEHVKEKMFTEDEMERFALYVETERSKEPNSGNTSISKYLSDFKKFTKK